MTACGWRHPGRRGVRGRPDGGAVRLLFGFATTASGLVDRAGADIWIASRGTPNVDQAMPITERRRFQALAIPGVVAATKYLVQFAQWQRPDGGSETVNLVGFDPEQGTGGPWNVVEGSIDALKLPDSIIVDQLYRQKLGITRLGQTVEINGHRARVVGFSAGIRAFTQSPYVFTAFKTAQTYAGWPRTRPSSYFSTWRPAPTAPPSSARSRRACPGSTCSPRRNSPGRRGPIGCSPPGPAWPW
ncbi:MAG: ABC transporter permease [Pseudomonadota bacterium]